MVLQDDAFSSIVLAVRQGRIIFDNIRKSVMFMLCTNIAEIISVGSAAVIGGFLDLPLPLMPLQILYLNIITDVFPALALGMGKGEKSIMEQPPRPREEPVLTRDHWKWICGYSLLMAICVMASLTISYYLLDFERYQAVTVSFLTLAFAKLWFVFNLRNHGTGFFKNDISSNPYMLGSLLLCSVLLILAVYLPGLSSVLKTQPPGLSGWALLIATSLVPFAWGQWRFIQKR
jgi:Ca2+-transporting ATPase